MPQNASAGVLRFCAQENSSNSPPVVDRNTVSTNKVGRSMTKCEVATVGTAFPQRPRRADLEFLAGHYYRRLSPMDRIVRIVSCLGKNLSCSGEGRDATCPSRSDN